jgi:hypothetical protein
LNGTPHTPFLIADNARSRRAHRRRRAGGDGSEIDATFDSLTPVNTLRAVEGTVPGTWCAGLRTDSMIGKKRFAVAACVLVATTFVADRARAEHATGGVPFVSGGVGEDARDELLRVAGAYDVHVLFASPAGAYIAGVHVVLRDRAGSTYLATVADGPWLFVNLPAGTYEMTASFDGRQLTKAFSVPDRGTRQLVFRWAAE